MPPYLPIESLAFRAPRLGQHDLFFKASFATATVATRIVSRSCFTKLYHRLIINRARYSTKDEHQQQFKDVFGKVHRLVNFLFTIFISHFMAFLRELKIAEIYLLVVSLCVFCYLPTVVVLGKFAHILNHDDKIPDSTVNAFEWAATLTSMNSSLNCRMFFWGNREMRREGSKILKKCFNRQQVQQLELNVVQNK